MIKLYIVHGWAYSTAKWQPTLKYLQEMGIKPEMLAVPGLTTASDKVWSIDDYVNWLAGELPAGNQSLVLGHSNGGRILLNLAVKKPELLKHIILLDSAGVWDSKLTTKLKRQILKFLSKILKPLAKIGIFKKFGYRVIGASDYNQAPANMKITLHNMISSDKQLDLSAVKTPVSIIWGSNDQTTPLSDADYLAQNLTNLKSRRMIAGAKHAPYQSHPKQLAEAINMVINQDESQ